MRAILILRIELSVTGYALYKSHIIIIIIIIIIMSLKYHAACNITSGPILFIVFKKKQHVCLLRYQLLYVLFSEVKCLSVTFYGV